MSIDSAQDSDAANQHRPIDMVNKTERASMAQQTQYSDMLLENIGTMACDVTAWSRPQQHFTSQRHQQQYGFTCPPTALTRHASMPGPQMLSTQCRQQEQHQQPPTSFAMGIPPTLPRHHSHGYIPVMQHQQEYQPAMNGTMPPRQVHVNEMQHLLEISMGYQQPLLYPTLTQQRMTKSLLVSSPSVMNVEPIAFAFTDNNTKITVDNLDPLAYAVFGNTSTLKSAHHGMPQDIQQIESAFDSLDRLLPEIEQEMMLQSSELNQVTQATVLSSPKTIKSPKCMVTCKVSGCERRVRSKGFCKTHGGGRKCSIEGCKKSSQNGDFCIGHGGGKKCKEVDCAKAAQSHGLCKAHGGGARCKFLNCTKSSQGGGLCRAHGGGKRCQASRCPKGAQRGNFCATHGGFRNCKIEGCVRTDRGGGFCEVHRRGRLCKVEGCKKLSRNQGMCTMHIREDKHVEIYRLFPASKVLPSVGKPLKYLTLTAHT
ncbi:hypothetical protein KXD40_004953 [Peronospora effusa]|uniref:WRKY19-like zinc finger domain-containing protein n=1 Tax=Peronospora effusa TaxID=542832 RepID=A0A3M6VEN7_9STRA|nr:hypothetical protein DD238_005561 [Peronospora effusa]RQM14578.1 hypothetical protein DD237_006012 [Peronospora effusa]UIZ22177.1 hypothetical protein KXD40_004953 [Peronospora effusa]CAI5708189.1 unnamed protein product [Peronospora effusa]